jgi:oligopeptide/dipeptide ABC transporter ATP-binding protein
MASRDEPILEARNLKKYYDANQGFISSLIGRSQDVKAVDGVDLRLREGETLGVVGESGCGKTTLGRTLIRLLEPTEGSVVYRPTPQSDRERDETDKVDVSKFATGETTTGQPEIELTEVSSSQLRTLRTDLQYIFQDPFESLNPRLTVGEIIGEPLSIHNIASGPARTERVRELLDTVGLNPSHVDRYPHEFSGGQRQRIGIARALAVDPEVIICDEPVSALDVSVQAQILNLLEELQDEFGLSYIFIAHDLSVVEHISDRIAVMYLGEFAEVGTTREVFEPPNHPYAEALLSAIPEPDPLWDGDRIFLPGDVPSPLNPPSGCRFHTRCPRVIQPDEYDLDQGTWRAIMDLKVRLRDADALESVVAVEEESGPRLSESGDPSADEFSQEDPETLSREVFGSRVREEFGIPDPVGDRTAEEELAAALDTLHDGNLADGSEQLEAAFTSPCEETNPELTTQTSTHEIACLLFEDEYEAAGTGQAARRSGADD